MENSFSPRLQALLTVALLLDGEEALPLFESLPREEKDLIMSRANKYLQLSEDDRRSALAAGLKALRSEFLLRQITDVHPSHIALVLTNEPAAIIRMIFYHLPAEMVEEAMRYFPERTIRQLAAYPNPPSVAPELLEVVKHAFIRQFTFILPGENPMTRLNATRLRALQREMSLQTIATAMRRIDRQELVESLQRFPRAYSKEIVRRIKLLRDVDPAQVLIAERCLVWLTAQQLRNFSIIDDTGLMLLAGALLNEGESLQKFLTQKFSIEEAGRFFDLAARLRQTDAELAAFANEQFQSCLASLLQPRRQLETSPEVNVPAANG
ncbi:MAG: hypothetical protein AB1489_00680 [Acidobacteriota bacterium]